MILPKLKTMITVRYKVVSLDAKMSSLILSNSWGDFILTSSVCWYVSIAAGVSQFACIYFNLFVSVSNCFVSIVQFVYLFITSCGNEYPEVTYIVWPSYSGVWQSSWGNLMTAAFLSVELQPR